MKMKNLFAGLVATTIVASSASAFAAPIANDAGYDKTAGTYSIVSDLSTYGADQMTILIIPEAAYLAGTINDADILYIDQAAADTANIFKSVGILGGTTLADGTYYAKIGGENIAADGIIVEKFTVQSGAIHRWGDVNDDGFTDDNDAMQILYYFNFLESCIPDDTSDWRHTYGDVIDNNGVDDNDAMQILYYFNFMDSTLWELLGEEF